MVKIVLVIIGLSGGWLVGLHFWIIFKLAGIVLGGYLTFASAIMYGFSGNSKESEPFAYLGIAIILGIIGGWLAVSSFSIDGAISFISDIFSVPEKID